MMWPLSLSDFAKKHRSLFSADTDEEDLATHHFQTDEKSITDKKNFAFQLGGTCVNKPPPWSSLSLRHD